MKNEDLTLGIVKEGDVGAFLNILRSSDVGISKCEVCQEEVNEGNFLASLPDPERIRLFCSKSECFSYLLLSMRERNGNGLIG